MGQVFSEGLEFIGRIDNSGYVFDKSDNCIAVIGEFGYITNPMGKRLGKIDKDGTIRNSAFEVIGDLQADGYVYIGSHRVCRIESDYLKKVSPDAKNYGHPTEYPNRPKPQPVNDDSSEFHWPISFGATVKIFVGFVLWIWFAFDVGFATLGFLETFVTLPMMIMLVFFVCGMIKFFNDIG